MTPNDTAGLLRGMYAAETAYLAAGGPGSGSFALLEPYFAPDVELHQADGLPYGGIWRGHDGLERFFVTMGETWSDFDLSDQTFLATTPELAVVLTNVRARARATGRDVSFAILQLVRIDDNRITDVRPFYWDTAAIAAACDRTTNLDQGRHSVGQPRPLDAG